jgi:hypothetical protein
MLRLFSWPTHNDSEILKNLYCFVVIVVDSAAYYTTLLEALLFRLPFLNQKLVYKRRKRGAGNFI